MGRILRNLTMLLLLLMPIMVVLSQAGGKQHQVASDGSEGGADSIMPPVEQTVEVPPAPTLDPSLPTPTPSPSPTIDPENTPEPTPFPSATPIIPVEVFLLLDVRSDMERLADDQLGVGVRPPGWNSNVSQYDPQITLLTRSDLEQLTNAIINPNTRPDGWMGAVPSTPYAIARDVRFDLELLANLIYGRTNRPAGWIGGDPLLRCNRATQTLVALLERGGVFRLEVAPNDPNFCRQTELAVTTFTETQILANAQLTDLFTDQVALLSPHEVNSDIAIAFLDTQATIRVGLIPNGTPIQVVARSYADFSNMMLVQGDSFLVFVDYTNTTVNDQQFRNLPNVTTLQISPNCFAQWCDNQG